MGDTATDNLTITITDDGPIAADDTDTIAAGAFGPVAGNLITDSEANGDNGTDTPGADGASVSSVIAATAKGPASAVGTDTVVEGLYGVSDDLRGRLVQLCAQSRHGGWRPGCVHLHAEGWRR